MNTFMINNVKVVTEYGIIDNGFVYVKRGIIMNVGRTVPGKIHRSCSIIDGNGGWLLPGFIDISNEQFTLNDHPSFDALEKTLTSHGITSVFHMIPDYQTTNDSKLEQLRRLGVIRHHFRTSLPVLNSYYIASAPAVSSGISIVGSDGAETKNHSLFNPTVSDMASHPSMYVICCDSMRFPILQSVYSLCHFYGVSLVDAVSMISLNPARAIGIDKRLGSIEWGKRADLVLINDSPDDTTISKVFVSGCIVYDQKASEINEEQQYRFRYPVNGKTQTSHYSRGDINGISQI